MHVSGHMRIKKAAPTAISLVCLRGSVPLPLRINALRYKIEVVPKAKRQDCPISPFINSMKYPVKRSQVTVDNMIQYFTDLFVTLYYPYAPPNAIFQWRAQQV